MATPGRDTGNWKRMARAFKATSARKKSLCWLCSQPIDYDLAWGDPFCFSIDHFHPVSTHPELAEVWSNLRASHYDCNNRRGNRAPQPSIGTNSRRW